MSTQTVRRNGRTYLLVREDEYRQLLDRAGLLPKLPSADRMGNRPAVQFARASIARTIIIRRTAIGWTQAELARQARVNVETLNRIERAKATADTATIAKLDAALLRGAGAGKVATKKRAG
jgi:DNA-binding XRE family transcriptional regulator